MLRLLSKHSERVDEVACREPLQDEARPQQTVQIGAIRETINLLEADLGAMIREVQQACHAVCREAEESAVATADSSASRQTA